VPSTTCREEQIVADFQLVILTKAVEGRKDELAHWYDAVHIPDHLRVPGYISARRHGVDRLDGPADSLHWDFMTVYELETEDPSAAIAKARRRLGTGEMPVSAALDMTMTLALLAAPVGREASSRHCRTHPSHLVARRDAVPCLHGRSRQGVSH
jgi:hypothetical protein